MVPKEEHIEDATREDEKTPSRDGDRLPPRKVGSDEDEDAKELGNGTATPSTTTELEAIPMGDSEEDEIAKGQLQNKDTTPNPPPSMAQRAWRLLSSFYQQNEFLILVVTVIGLARLYPPLGAIYLYPHITSTWIAICFIFLLSGITLPSAELAQVFTAWKLHLFVQSFSFGLDSVLLFGVSRLLLHWGLVHATLADGMILVGTLPMTINSAYVLTKCANGDEAAALFNSILGNMLGIFVSPVLLFLYSRVGTGSVDVGAVFLKLALRVVLPTAVGQVLQKTTPILDWIQEYKPYVKKLHQFAMVYVVYTIFCRTFLEDNSDEDGNTVSDIFRMIVCQFLLLVFLMVLAWYSLAWATPRQRVFGVFGCTHKTMAIGILLVDAVVETGGSSSAGDGAITNPGLYALPLLVYHPMQLVLGTIVAPRLAQYVEKHECEEEDDGCACPAPNVLDSGDQESCHSNNSC